MAEFDREAYRKQIAALPREVRARLAYRNALRCLPLLAANSAFAYWPAEDRLSHLVLREDCRLSPGRFGKNGELPTVKYQDLLALEREGYGEYVCEFGKYDLAALLKLFPRECRQRDAQRLDIRLGLDVALRVDVKLLLDVSDSLGSLLYQLSREKAPQAQALAQPLEAVHQQLEALQQQPENPALLQRVKQSWEAVQRVLDAAENTLDQTDKYYGKAVKIGAKLARLWGALHGIGL